MDWTLIVTSIVLGLAIGLYIAYRREAKKSIVFLSEEEFVLNMRKAQLIDIRKKDAYETGHINGARHIPAAILMRQPGRLRRDLPIYLVDHNGKMSKRTALMLYGRGFDTIFALDGGMSAYKGHTKAAKK